MGKTGIESVYEEQLRGFYGKKKFCADSKGNFLFELPVSQPPLSGNRILLTLSAELQEYAEQLLAQNENLRIVRKSKLGAIKQTVIAEKQPWIKGGAIVVMDPLTAEILTLASYPRFDPNDFILSGNLEEQRKKKGKIHQWFENESYIAQLWDLQRPLERERYYAGKRQFYDEKSWITWNNYLNFILPAGAPLRHMMDEIHTIGEALEIQSSFEQLFNLFSGYDIYALMNIIYADGEHQPYKLEQKKPEKELALLVKENEHLVHPIKKCLGHYFNQLPENYDKVLLVDLCRLAVADDRFSAELINAKGNESLESFHEQAGSLVTLLAFVKENVKELHHIFFFEEWRRKEEKEFLKRKRENEKLAKTYPKPYVDYLDQQESLFFREFWEYHIWELVAAFLKKESSFQNHLLAPYIAELLKIQDANLDKSLSWQKDYVILQDAVKELPLELAIVYLKAMRSFEELKRPLLGSYRYLKQGEPKLEKHLAAAFYPAYGYGHGRSFAYRQASIQGSLFKLVTAYEALVQRFKKFERKTISAKELNPLIITDEVYSQGGVNYVGYTEEGKPIPQLYKGGRLPRSLAHQHIGRVDLVRALEMSSNPYCSLLAGECLEHPEDLANAARLFSYGCKTGIELPSEIPGKVPDDLSTNRTGLYATAIGQAFFSRHPFADSSHVSNDCQWRQRAQA